MSDDNVTNIRPGKVTPIDKKADPDWLRAANSVKNDFTAERDKPMALSDDPKRELEAARERHPAGKARHDVMQHLSELSTSLPIQSEELNIMRTAGMNLELKAEQDPKQFQEIDPQRRVAFIVALVLACLIFATSALFSFPTIAATAALMLPVWGFLVWVVPGFVEAFIVYFGIETIIWQARAANEKKYSAGQRTNAQKMSDSSLWWQVAFTMVAVIANGAHTFMGYETTNALGTWQAWLGIGLASLAPLSVVLITKRASRLIFIYAVKE